MAPPPAAALALAAAVLAAHGLRGGAMPAVATICVLVRRRGVVAALPVAVRARVLGPHARPALALDADLVPGDSGAPVVAPGRVLGVVFARSTAQPGTAYAVETR